MNWGPLIFGLIVILLAACKRFIPSPGFHARGFSWLGCISKISYKSLIWIVLVFKVAYASLETFGQYYVWKSSEFTKLFLDPKTVDFNILKEFSGKLFWAFNNRLGYFIFYSWGRFWMTIVVSLLAAAAFYLFLLFLKKYKERFFEEGEVELGFLLALTIGWPNFIAFLFAAFLSVILVSAIRMIFFKEFYTTLGAPFLLAALAALVFGNYFINFFNLMAFRV